MIQAQDLVVLKSHKLKNNFISITYAIKLGNNSVTTEKTIELEEIGGAKKTLQNHFNS